MDLLRYLLNSLSPEERAEVAEAIKNDPATRKELESLRRLIALLALEEDVDPPSGLAERTIAAASDPILTAARANEFVASGPRLRMVEFCVVASILLLLAVLVLPAIAILRGEAGRVVCSDNLRQLGLAMSTYSDLENGQLPTGDPHGPLDNAGIFALLLHAQGLLPDANVLICPMADSSVVYVAELTEYLAEPADSLVREMHRRQMGGSYGYTLGHDLSGVYEVPEEGAYSAVASDRPPRPGDVGDPDNSPNHGGLGQNVLFADGHVEFLGTAKLGDDLLYRNADGRIAAGAGFQDVCIGVSEATPYPRDPVKN